MYEKELQAMIEAAYLAEVHIKKVYASAFEVEIKEDDSPVTVADKGADEIIRGYLSERFPEYGFLTEESADTGERFSHRRIFIVDPVDGTTEFVSRNGQFTTNIALCEDNEIVVGVINVPMLDRLYFAVKGEGAYRLVRGGTKERIHVSDRKTGLKAMRSISHYTKGELAFMESHASVFEEEVEAVGAANKFCRLAEGEKDFYYRDSPYTKEWDVAPGDLLVREAGGYMVEPDGKPFTYNRKDVYNRKGYVMANSKENLFLDDLK